MKKKTWLTGMSAILLAAGISFITPVSARAEETLPRGIYVGEQDLGGKTVEEAEKIVEDYVNGLSNQKITLDVDGTPVDTTAQALGFYWTNQEVVKETAAVYQNGNIIQRFFAISDLEAEPLKLALDAKVDEGKVAEFVEAECSGLVAEAQDATITRENGQFIVTPSVTGLVIDSQATAGALNEAIAAGLEKPVTASAVVTKQEPARKTEDLETIQDLLGTYTTDFSSSGASRSTNLRVGAGKINGHVLMPGETLSGYECMQPFTTANGYATAAAYENGQVVDSVGGGVCQIATTLYNTSLLAEMEITQRQNHSMIVTYVKPSMDAAIAGTFKDIKITNPYDTPVYVEGYTSGKTLTFSIYGKETRPANRTIKYVSETLSVTDPGAPAEQVDPTMAPGTRKQVQSAHRGMKSRLWKYVYVDGVEKEKTLLHTDTYNASKAIVKVGPAAPPVVAPVETPPVTEETTAPQVIEGPGGGPGVSGPPAQSGGQEQQGPGGPGAGPS